MSEHVPTPAVRRRGPRRRITALTAITLVAALGLHTAYAVADTGGGDGDTSRSGPQDKQGEQDTQETGVMRGLVDELVRDGVRPGALVATQERDGRTRTYAAGTADLATPTPVPADGQIRIGSNTKTFTAVVVLQLVGEGRIGLDEPVETYLPGLLRGEGIDGRGITVRQLLQHTSGLPEYVQAVAGDYAAFQHRYTEPRELIDMALEGKASFQPGERWEYSNTNYIVAGLIVQKVTGRPLGEEITQRIIRRIGLRHTYFPRPGEMTIREEHPKGYHADQPGKPLRDVSVSDPSSAWAAGAMVSTNEELNRFFTALLDGELLEPEQLKAMRTTVEATGHPSAGARYGLGLKSQPLSCGGVYWGHGGDIPGYETRGGVTDEGRAVSFAVTVLPGGLSDLQQIDDAVDSALCR
ncbi:serine hydrolase domain-containing protein [Streptomyces sp. NPDC059092]|uniref:serine hydrolase domain-containing protein n=1 Tax=Streptomyces sp. NPDC059092 TaxID=3346725 RepID=UPI00367D93CB